MRLRRELLEQEAARLTGQRVRVVADELPEGVGGVATHDGRTFVVKLSRRLFADPALLAKAYYHELGHIRLGHVGPPTALSVDPPPLVRAAWAENAAQQEREADRYAGARWAALGAYAEIVFRALALDDEGSK